MLLCAVSCSETPSVGDETTRGQESLSEESRAETTVEVTTEPEETEPELALRVPGVTTVPADLDYGNEVTVLYWSDYEFVEFSPKMGEDMTVIGNNVYKRNVSAANYLGLKQLSWIGVDGDYGEMENFAQHVGNSYIAGERKYDIIATYSRTAALCAINGYLADLNAVEDSYINLEHDWWPQSLGESLTIDDALYFLSGDISTSALQFMYVIFCNLDMAEALRLEDPVSLALREKWTLDAFKALAEGVFSEQNGDGTPSSGDRFGFLTEQLHLEAFYAGSGLKLIEKDEEKTLALSGDFTGSKLTQLVDDLAAFARTKDVRVAGGSATHFAEGNALFAQNRMNLAGRMLKTAEFKYAILPTPMYDVKQDGYRTTLGNPFTLWGIMRDVEEEREMLLECTAVIESLAYEGYLYTTPAVFEENTRLKYDDEANLRAIACYELIREGMTFDYGRILPGAALSDPEMSTLFGRAIVNSDDFENVKVEEYVSSLRQNLQAIIAELKERNG